MRGFQSGQYMYMTATPPMFRARRQSANRAAQVFVKPPAAIQCHQRHAVLRRKDEMVMKTGIGRWHGEFKPSCTPPGCGYISNPFPGYRLNTASTPATFFDPSGVKRPNPCGHAERG